MGYLTSLQITASALTAQRLRMDVIANNVANAETTHTAEGGPYRREQVVFRPIGPNRPFQLPPLVAARRGQSGASSLGAGGVQVEQVIEDQTPGPTVYEPDHPDADANGFVTYPNVNLVTEMTDLLSATRSYEANVTVANAAKSMALRALDIGRI